MSWGTALQPGFPFLVPEGSLDTRTLATRASRTAYVVARAPLEAKLPFMPSAAIARSQRQRIRAAVAHAYEHVPYYRETMRRLGLRPTDFRCAGDLARLPLIERGDLQRDPEYFVSQLRPLGSYVPLRTGGSTGRPIAVFHDAGMVFQGAAQLGRMGAVIAKLTGHPLRCRTARIVPPRDATPAVMHRAYKHGGLVSPSLRMKFQRLWMQATPAENLPAINAFQPHVINSFGSYVEALFAHVHATGAPFHHPRVAVYHSDALSEWGRRLILEQLGVHVLSFYQAVETPAIAFECEHHLGQHLNADLCPVRIIGSTGEDLPAGETGEIVVSNLVSRGTVLLNYRLGDLVKRLPERCPCGRNLPLLSFIEARSEDWLRTPSGGELHPLPLMILVRSEQHVLSYQVVQETPTHFIVRLVVAPSCERSQVRERLARGLAEWMGADVQVDVSFVKHLPRGPGGKVRAVISKVAR